MVTKLNAYFILTLIIISSCGKNKNNDNQTTTIDVSKQWLIDQLGNIVSSPGDGQWHRKTFTTQELSLFNSLDTANLNGTTTPDSLFESLAFFTYPNPFVTTNFLSLRFANGFSGQIVLKCVIVDSLMTPLFKAAARLNIIATTVPPFISSTSIAFNPTVPIGRFRVYYTLSSQLNPHFYNCWGNIQKWP